MERAAVLYARGPVLPKHLPPLADPSGKADEPGSGSDDGIPAAGTLKGAENPVPASIKASIRPPTRSNLSLYFPERWRTIGAPKRRSG
jgi:hypothetical protein